MAEELYYICDKCGDKQMAPNEENAVRRNRSVREMLTDPNSSAYPIPNYWKFVKGEGDKNDLLFCPKCIKLWETLKKGFMKKKK